MQATSIPNNESSYSQCNLTVMLCCGERASTLNEQLIIRGFRDEREKSVLYNITCLGEILVPLPAFNLLNQSLKKRCGGVSIRQTELDIPTSFTPMVLYVISITYKSKLFSEKKRKFR